MTHTEALRLALEALKEIIHWYAVRDRNDVLLNFVDQNPEIKKAMTAITAIEAALEAKDEPVVWNEGVPAMLPKQKEGETFIVSYEPKLEAKDEPMAWMHVQGNHEEPSLRQLDDWEIQNGWKQYPLYTTPPQPVIDESAAKRIATASGWKPQRTWVRLIDEDISEIVRGTHNTGSFVRAIEARLKEKNT